MASSGRRPAAGRPEATSHAEIEQAAFRLFAERGFEATTLDAIAAEVGVGRRTLFRYCSLKNDIPWGQFDRTLDGFRQMEGRFELQATVARACGVAAGGRVGRPAGESQAHRDRRRAGAMS